MSLFRAVCYVLAQLLGATIGAAMARHVSPEIFDRCVPWDSGVGEGRVRVGSVGRFVPVERVNLTTIHPPKTPHVPPCRYNGGINYVTPDVTIGGAFLAEFMGAFKNGTITHPLSDRQLRVCTHPDPPPINKPPAGTFVLVFTVFCAIDTERGDEVFHMPTLAPLAIGLSVTLMHFGMIGIDNCSINPGASLPHRPRADSRRIPTVSNQTDTHAPSSPRTPTARSFGASAVAGIWTDHWLFWFGPMTGAICAAFMYELVFKSRKNWENKYLPFAQA